jgi:hypothetical protein
MWIVGTVKGWASALGGVANFNDTSSLRFRSRDPTSAASAGDDLAIPDAINMVRGSTYLMRRA